MFTLLYGTQPNLKLLCKTTLVTQKPKSSGFVVIPWKMRLFLEQFLSTVISYAADKWYGSLWELELTKVKKYMPKKHKTCRHKK